MTVTRYLFAASALALAGAAAPAAAQIAPAADNSDEIIVTAARVEQAASEVGQAVTVVTRDEIDRRQAVSVADLLSTTPGVTVTRNGSLGGFTGVRLRGAEAEQTLVVIDGVRVNDPSSPGGGFDFANLLSASVERVEVLRGPNSVPWGSQAIGGVVNVITEAPTERLKARAGVEYGYADSVFAQGGVSGRSGAFSGALTGGYLRSDGISAAADGSERDGYRQYGATARLGIDFTDGIGLDLRGYWADSKTETDGYPAPNYVLADDPSYSTAQELYGYAGLHANFVNFRNRVAFTIADINRDTYAGAGATPSPFRGRSERYEYQGDFQPIEQVRVVGGVEHEDSRYRDASLRRSVGVTSVYGELIVKPIRPLTITGGVRNDDHDTFGNHTTFGADAALALASATTLRASYGEGFKAPTLYQLYSDYGNTRLDPETAKNYDLGVEQGLLGGRATIGATYFHRDTRNQIGFRGCSRAEQGAAGSICANRPFGVYDNIQRTRAEGVEVAIGLRPVDALTVSANFSYIDSQNRTPGTSFGTDLLRRPKETAAFVVDYRLPFGLGIGGTVQIVGDSVDSDSYGNRVQVDGYALASIRAELPLGDRFSVYGRIDNLTDERYFTVAEYGTYGRAAYGGIRVKL
ncbi:TonB-dependent receptor [Sphingomonas sp. MA1305]|uniref:TonB-dependent receptor plug domain-containing protein n=1 Tax=Sphingomonas sp. MA1305 TaxID=2479204 RepID=UPI0018DF8BED|nr:TonB-dependent receptor [Sphingomonas sp. MA1305]MBI0476780.1 TonB-dependent receptor [Sphingomonas sp. MA1305]